ncbi:MAG: hypothetical protein HZC54_16525 [Verrucomicrobia bacterium]|nr:hypothetical protein [Verrucomicrobiota bacterium]
MKPQRYFPSRAGDQIIWLTNFRNKLPQYATQLGLDPARVAEVIATCGFVLYVLEIWLVAVRTFGPTSTAAVNLLLNGDGKKTMELPAFNAPPLPQGVAPVATGALERIFKLVAAMKVSPAFTEAIGLDLGVVARGGGAAAVAADTHSPDIQLEVVGGKVCQAVKVHFVKHGHTGVWIECKRGGGKWEFVAVDTGSPYLDERPLLVAGQPEVREYRVCFWDKGEPNNEWTNIVTITVGP